MKLNFIIASVVGLFIVLAILTGCQLFGPPALPTASSTIALPPTYTPTPVATPPTPLPSPTPAPELTLLDDEVLDIAAVAFRYITHYNDASADAGPAVYLTLFGEDPSSEFLARFADQGKQIRGGSEFVEGEGLKFFIDRVERVSENRVEVSAGYYEASLSAAGYIYTLELRDGHWVVIDKQMEWIS